MKLVKMYDNYREKERISTTGLYSAVAAAALCGAASKAAFDRYTRANCINGKLADENLDFARQFIEFAYKKATPEARYACLNRIHVWAKEVEIDQKSIDDPASTLLARRD